MPETVKFILQYNDMWGLAQQMYFDNINDVASFIKLDYEIAKVALTHSRIVLPTNYRVYECSDITSLVRQLSGVNA